MQWYDWLIAFIPVTAILGVGVYTTKYVKGVVDFLSAGRLCNRYILLVGDLANGISILTIVMMCEQHYKGGFAVGIWNAVLIPLTLTLALFGFVAYRFRETKAQSFGQFLELRYASKSLRVFASGLRSFAELLSHAIMPAVAGRFFLYFLGFPAYINVFGMEISVFVLTMCVCMAMSIFIICCGGTLSIVITDAVQGMICLPLIVFFSFFLLYKFNWADEVIPVLTDRAPGQSFLNPYDIMHLRDFNLLLLVLGVTNVLLHGASWIGGGASGAAFSPHEQKMASIIGKWRSFFSPLLYLVLSISVLVILNHEHFSAEAREIRTELSAKVASDVVKNDPVLHQTLLDNISSIPEQKHKIGIDKPLSHTENLDTIYIETARRTFENAGVDNGAYLTQQFNTLYHQSMLAVSMRKLLSPGMMGLFCLLAILAMLSTDTSFIFSSVGTIVQDVILPFMKKVPSGLLHIWLFRLTAVFVGVVSVLISVYVTQLDYLQLFMTIILSLWMGGCGPMCIFALYGRFGTKQGAWSSMLGGLFITVGAMYLQRNWADTVYPFLERHQLVDAVGRVFEALSAPLEPLVVWQMNPEKFPINSNEAYILTMIFSLLIYLAVSFATCKEPFNLERMLHRGIYNVDGKPAAKTNWHFKNLIDMLAGITPEHTRGDKAISYSLLIYTYIYNFGLCFLLIVIWNSFSKWPIQWWSKYFFITQVIVPVIAVGITSIWFSIGGVYGLIDLFRNLRTRGAVDHLDNGMVENGISLADEAKFHDLEKEKK